MPWWLKLAYMEGLRAEGILKSADGAAAPEPEMHYRPQPQSAVSEAVKKAARTTIDQSPLSASLDEFGSLGLTVIRGGKE